MESNKTREGIEVKVGQVWQDLDKRMDGRTVLVENIDYTSDRACNGPVAEVRSCYGPNNVTIGSISRISIRRMHKHSTGWKLIKDTDQ